MMEHLKRVPYLLLAIMAAYAAYEMPPDQRPYAFSACAFGIIFGFYGAAGGEEMQCSVVKAVVDTGFDFIPLSLMNIEIYLAMGKPYAMVHALFIIPLILDIIAKLFGDEGDDEVTQLLKHVNNIANVASLASLSYMDDNRIYACVAASFFTAQSAKIWGGRCHGYSSDLAYTLAYTAFYYTSMLAITVPNEIIDVKKEAA